MSNFIILTDSSADLDGELAKRLDVLVLPLRFTVQGRTCRAYPDHREMSPRDFYQLLRVGQSVSTAIEPEEYVRAMEPYLRMGRDILLLAPSSGLSGAFSAAVQAARQVGERYPSRKVEVVDTLCASLGLGLLAWMAARERSRGRSLQEVRDWTESRRLDLCHHLAAGSLSFLRQNGKISGAASVMDSILHLEPLLRLDDEGRLASLSQVRGRQAALRALVDRMEVNAIDPREQTVFLCHGDCPEDAQLVAQMIRDRMGVQRVYVNCGGPAFGALAGPDALGLFYMGVDR